MLEEKTLDRLAWNLGTTVVELERMRELARHYHTCQIPKRRAGVRILAIPPDDLKRFQRKLLRRLLVHATVSRAVHGSVKRRSPTTHAAVHRGACAAYIIDLADAFSQATRALVAAAWERMHYFGIEAEFLADVTTWNNALPQGAPTSNTLWNLVCRDLDMRCVCFAEAHGLIYSRYTDELVFSHPAHISRELQLALRQLVRDAGFRANPRKVRVHHARNGALPITGVSVHDGRIGLTRSRLDRVRGFVFRAALDSTIPASHVHGAIGQVRQVYDGRLPTRIQSAFERFLAARQSLTARVR